MTTTPDLVASLRRHYIADQTNPGGIFLTEVGVNGGHGSSSRCDALYAGFTSASGRILIGHEVKVTRYDWLRELKHAEKADRWADACHAWYLVVPDPGLVQPGELPAGWGLLHPATRAGRRRLVCAVPSTLYRPRGWSPPWWAARSVLARSDTLLAARLHDETRRIRDEVGRAERERLARRHAEHGVTGGVGLTPEQRDILSAAEDLRERYGLDLTAGLAVGRFGDGDHPVRARDLHDALALVPLVRRMRDGYGPDALGTMARHAEVLEASGAAARRTVAALAAALAALAGDLQESR